MADGHGFVCRLVAGTRHATRASPGTVFNRLANATWDFSQRYWRLIVVAMLALLHVAVFRGVADPWARALLLAHLGLVLLWQPFLRAEQRVSPLQGADSCRSSPFAVMLRLDWWLLAFWVVVLAGLVGGKVYQQHARWQRRCYLAGACLPARAARDRDPSGDRAAPRDRRRRCARRPSSRCRSFFVLIALIPAEPEPGRGGADDRLLLQRVPDAAARGGDPRQLHAHDRAPHRATWRRSPTRSSSPPAPCCSSHSPGTRAAGSAA